VAYDSIFRVTYHHAFLPKLIPIASKFSSVSSDSKQVMIAVRYRSICETRKAHRAFHTFFSFSVHPPCLITPKNGK